MHPAPDVWRDLLAYVLPRAMIDTALLLGGVGALALLIGAGTAWLISLHDFRGRALLVWLMPLPLAIPDLSRRLCLRRSVRAAGAGASHAGDLVSAARRGDSASQSALDAGRDRHHRPRALSLCLSFGADHVPVPERRIRRGRQNPRRQTLDRVLARLAADGAAGAGGGRRAGVAGNAERHRRQRISRRPDPDGVDLHHLAQSRQPRRGSAAFLLHAGDRGRPDRDRALWPPQHHVGVFRRKPAADAANPAHRHQGLRGACGVPAAGAARLRGAGAVSAAAEFSPRAAGEFRHDAGARRLQFDRVRDPCHADRARARLRDHSGVALAAECRCGSSP